MNSMHDIPGSHFKTQRIILVAAGTDKKYAIGRAPFRGTLVAARLVFDVTLTGNSDTNYVKASIINGGQAGAGTTLMASKEYKNGIVGTLLVPELLTNEAAANLNFAAGDVFIYLSDQVASGIQDEAKIVELEFKAR